MQYKKFDSIEVRIQWYGWLSLKTLDEKKKNCMCDNRLMCFSHSFRSINMVYYCSNHNQNNEFMFTGYFKKISWWLWWFEDQKYFHSTYSCFQFIAKMGFRRLSQSELIEMMLPYGRISSWYYYLYSVHRHKVIWTD